jgi:hypothetical protein
MQSPHRLFNAIAVATVIAGITTTAPAAAVFLGALKQNQTAQMTFVNQSTDSIAVTVLVINHRHDIPQAVPYTIPAADSTPGSGELTIPVFVHGRTLRVILLVAPPGGGLCSLRVNSGPAAPIEGDAQITFDTEP